jgi:hypothetical protein
VNSCCFDFRFANSYIMAGDSVVASVKLCKRLMLRYDDTQKGFEL